MVLCKTVHLQLSAILLPSIKVSLILPKYGLQKLRIIMAVLLQEFYTCSIEVEPFLRKVFPDKCA